MKKPIIIAGPCAAESREQILISIAQAKKRNVDFMRVSLWKPRTKPGFEGLGLDGLSLMIDAAKMGVNPGTEVVMPHHAEKVIEAVLNATPDGKVLVWIGARNQNHMLQQEIARIASQDKRVYLLVKNQPWHNEEHFEGIVEHVLTGGIAKENLIICHRGFAPHSSPNPNNYRNLPDHDMAMRIQEKYNVPMVFDPSHTAGNVEIVFKIAKEATEHNYQGLIVEVHPDPKNAKTDAKQQLTWEQFDELAKPETIQVTTAQYEVLSA